jgi:hypothetical protein
MSCRTSVLPPWLQLTAEFVLPPLENCLRSAVRRYKYAMDLRTLGQKIIESTREDWHKITCWGISLVSEEPTKVGFQRLFASIPR